jgi:hypothetical protein
LATPSGRAAWGASDPNGAGASKGGEDTKADAASRRKQRPRLLQPGPSPRRRLVVRARGRRARRGSPVAPRPSSCGAERGWEFVAGRRARWEWSGGSWKGVGS